MKIQCDVCGKQEAAFFCCADEAALCEPCDRRVHRANKLASKHRRFSLLHHPSLAPLCDICQEKKAFLFCQEDRAILCRDCDAPIHAANEHTRKHNRFLLAGVKLSPVPASDSDPTPSSSCSTPEESDTSVQTQNKVAPDQYHHQAPAPEPTPASTTSNSRTTTKVEESSTISDYLIKMLPGWHVEDLLLELPSPAASSVDILSKLGFGDDLLPFLDGCRGSSAPALRVPQVPQVGAGFQFCQDGASGGRGQPWWGGDDVFAVPQMAMIPPQQQQNPSNKRPRGGAW